MFLKYNMKQWIINEDKNVYLKNTFRDPWVAQRFSAAFGPGHDPGDPGSSPMLGSLYGACFSLCLSLSVSHE